MSFSTFRQNRSTALDEIAVGTDPDQGAALAGTYQLGRSNGAATVAALAETSGMPPPAPLDVGNPVMFRAGMAARAQWAATGTRTFETAPMPALTTAEAGQVRAALDAADPAGKARIYGDIVASTSGQTRAATLAKLGAKGVDGMVEAYAGAMTGVDPAIGESIIRGQSALKLKDAYNPMKDGNRDDSSAAIDNAGHQPSPAIASSVCEARASSASRATSCAMRFSRARPSSMRALKARASLGNIESGNQAQSYGIGI